MILIAVLGALVGTAILGPSLGFGDLERDIATDGSSDRLVPGTISFSVNESLDDAAEDQMTVGIALSSDASPDPVCTLTDDGGTAIELDPPITNQQLLDPEYTDYVLVGSARLDPGEYEATCEVDGEPSSSSGLSFAVGRSFGMEDVTGMLRPLAGLLVVLGVAALMFIVGVVLLIVGLVQRSKSKRPPYQAGPYQGPGPYPGPGPYQGPAPGQGTPGQPPYPGQQPPYQPPQYQPAPTAPPQGPAPTAPAPPPTTPPPDPTPQEGSVGGWTIPPSKQ